LRSGCPDCGVRRLTTRNHPRSTEVSRRFFTITAARGFRAMTCRKSICLHGCFTKRAPIIRRSGCRLPPVSRGSSGSSGVEALRRGLRQKRFRLPERYECPLTSSWETVRHRIHGSRTLLDGDLGRSRSCPSQQTRQIKEVMRERESDGHSWVWTDDGVEESSKDLSLKLLLSAIRGDGVDGAHSRPIFFFGASTISPGWL